MRSGQLDSLLGSLSSTDRWPRIRPTLDREEPVSVLRWASTPTTAFWGGLASGLFWGVAGSGGLVVGVSACQNILSWEGFWLFAVLFLAALLLVDFLALWLRFFIDDLTWADGFAFGRLLISFLTAGFFDGGWTHPPISLS